MRRPGRSTRVRTCISWRGIGPRKSIAMRATRMSARGWRSASTCASSAVGGLPCCSRSSHGLVVAVDGTKPSPCRS